MSTDLCHYCTRPARYIRPATSVQICLSCAKTMVRQDWTELARRQLHHYPNEWVSDVASFIQRSAEVEAKATAESVIPLVFCDGCDGSVCGAAHSRRQPLPVIGRR